MSEARSLDFISIPHLSSITFCQVKSGAVTPHTDHMAGNCTTQSFLMVITMHTTYFNISSQMTVPV